MLRLVALACLVSCVPVVAVSPQQRLDLLCNDPQATYQHGYNKGMQHEPMNTAWIDMYCMPQSRDTLRQAYLAGYQQGAQYAPAPVAAAPYPYPPAYGYAPPPRCELNSDGTQTCGYNCELGSDGHHYCASTPAGRCGLQSDGSWACP